MASRYQVRARKITTCNACRRSIVPGALMFLHFASREWVHARCFGAMQAQATAADLTEAINRTEISSLASARAIDPDRPRFADPF